MLAAWETETRFLRTNMGDDRSPISAQSYSINVSSVIGQLKDADEC